MLAKTTPCDFTCHVLDCSISIHVPTLAIYARPSVSKRQPVTYVYGCTEVGQKKQECGDWIRIAEHMIRVHTSIIAACVIERF